MYGYAPVFNIMKKPRLILLVIFVFSFLGCNKDRWEGFVFPKRDNKLIQRDVGWFNSLEECRNKSMEMLKELGAVQDGYYECSKNCKPGSSFYMRKCEETVR
jgi:hypothetical protein